jgi:hypothetical protein
MKKQKGTTAVVDQEPTAEERDTFDELREREAERQRELDRRWRETAYRMAAGEKISTDELDKLVIAARRTVAELTRDKEICESIQNARKICSDENRRRIAELGQKYAEANTVLSNREKEVKEELSALSRTAAQLNSNYHDERQRLAFAEADLKVMRQFNPHLFGE